MTVFTAAAPSQTFTLLIAVLVLSSAACLFAVVMTERTPEPLLKCERCKVSVARDKVDLPNRCPYAKCPLNVKERP